MSSASFLGMSGGLDALVWFIEESKEALLIITRQQSGRFRLEETQTAGYLTERTKRPERLPDGTASASTI
jgi:hypothetical protein